MALTPIHEVRFPTKYRLNTRGGPRFSTTVVILGSGFEQRNVNWETARREYTLELVERKDADLEEVLAFFLARQGRAYGFRVKDPDDHTLARQVVEADANDRWQVYKRYTSGGVNHDRTLKKIVSGTFQLWKSDVLLTNGVQYNVNLNTGEVTWTGGNEPGSGDVVEAACEFDVPVRFNVDVQQLFSQHATGSSWPSVGMIELRRKAYEA